MADEEVMGAEPLEQGEDEEEFVDEGDILDALSGLSNDEDKQ